MIFIKRVLSGFIIGGGMILPGVSGSVLAVILGLYRAILDAFANLSKDFRKNSRFLTPIILGVFLGAFVFAKILFFVFEKYDMEAKYTFIGLILGGVPVLYRELETNGSKKLSLLSFSIAFAISLGLFVLGKNTLNIDFSPYLDEGLISFVLLFFSGFIFVLGKIIPGISSSFMLMLIGMYQFFLSTLKDLFGLSTNQYLQLIPFVLGIIVGAILCVKIMRYLMDNYFSKTYSVILGFVIGSITAIYPGFSLDYRGFISILLFIAGFYITFIFSRVKKDKSIDK